MNVMSPRTGNAVIIAFDKAREQRLRKRSPNRPSVDPKALSEGIIRQLFPAPLAASIIDPEHPLPQR